MRGKVESGQLCRVEPVDPTQIEVDDIVLAAPDRRLRIAVARIDRTSTVAGDTGKDVQIFCTDSLSRRLFLQLKGVGERRV